MAKIIFFPIGNADSTLINLNDGRILLFDYCNRPLDKDDKRVNLEEEIRNYLKEKNRDYVDLVGFSHADDDHIFGAENLFWFDHAKKYQGENKVKIKTMVIPACFLLETGLTGTARILREEAKFRLVNGTGILVIGEPESLDDWLRDEGISPESRANLILRAGKCIPGFSKQNSGVDIFIHSPFTFKLENESVPRNSNCLILHLTFEEGNKDMSLMLGGDADCKDWQNIIYISRKNGNENRLIWDIFHISHHCSYTALSEEKGTEKTKPFSEIEDLFNMGLDNSYLISPSDLIPSYDTEQPPHRQAAAYYKEIAEGFGSKDNFLVNMEWPTIENPRPMVFETTIHKFKLLQDKSTQRGTAVIIGRPSPRLG